MFRKVPPLEVLTQILRALKFTGLEDRRWFCKEDLPTETLDDWLPVLEPYYLPCKAERYLQRDMTQARIITVLRHVCKANAIEFKVQERVVQGHKVTFYQIFYDAMNPIVSFD
jgi:hypothetical protein